MLLKSVNVLLIFLFIRETVTVRSEADVYKLSRSVSNKDIDESSDNSAVARSIENLNMDVSDRVMVHSDGIINLKGTAESGEVNDAATNFNENLRESGEIDDVNNAAYDDRAETNKMNDNNEEIDPLKDTDDTERFKNKILLEQGFDLTPEEMEKFKIWQNGLIPYYIDVVSFSDKVIRETIREFLQTVNGMTSVNFIELPSPPIDENTRWVMFLNRRGLLECADHSVKDFTTEGVQKVVLGYDCMTTGGELAEAVMSILGIPAQHNAPDRDDYVNIKTENILPDKMDMFEKLSDQDWLFHDLDYDFNSVTHYDYNKYTANGHSTIEPKDPNVKIFRRLSFSKLDVMKIQMLYSYISNKRKIKKSECKKLFIPGNKTSQVPIDQPKRLPRERNCKYLGNCGQEDSKENKRVQLKNSESMDPLSFMSDYQTSDDNPASYNPESKANKKALANILNPPYQKGPKKNNSKLKFGKPGGHVVFRQL